MELGLSLGDSSKSVDVLLKEKNTNQQKPTKKKCDLDFCMALSLNSYATLENDQENENDDHLQLNLLPIVPSHLQSPDNGKSSGNTVLPAARRSDVNRIPATAEEVSSANSTGSHFDHMDFGTYKSIGNENIRHGNKRDHIKASRNDVVEAKRASNDDENGLNTRKKLRLSKQQSAFLEESFKEHHTLNPKQKLALAKQLNLRPRQIEVWFQNRRARTKLKQTELNREHLKRCCEILTNENRRLHKELRALKTMCHSCQHVSTAPTVTVASTPKTLSFRQTRPRLIYPCPQNTC